MLPSIKHIYIYKVLFFESAYVFLTSYPALLYWFTYIGSYFFIYICNKFSSPMNFKLFLHMYFVVWEKYICNIFLCVTYFWRFYIYIFKYEKRIYVIYSFLSKYKYLHMYSSRYKYNQGDTRISYRKCLCLQIWIFQFCRDETFHYWERIQRVYRNVTSLQTGIWNEIIYYNYKFIINGNNKYE